VSRRRWLTVPEIELVEVEAVDATVLVHVCRKLCGTSQHYPRADHGK
jgi:hypothetical protein